MDYFSQWGWPHLISGINGDSDVRAVCKGENRLACADHNHNQVFTGREEDYAAQLIVTLGSDHGEQRYTKVSVLVQLVILLFFGWREDGFIMVLNGC